MKHGTCSEDRECDLASVEEGPKRRDFSPELPGIRSAEKGDEGGCRGQIEEAHCHKQGESHADLYATPHGYRKQFDKADDPNPDRELDEPQPPEILLLLSQLLSQQDPDPQEGGQDNQNLEGPEAYTTACRRRFPRARRCASLLIDRFQSKRG